MNNDLDAKTVEWMRRCGHSDKAISSYSKETELFHDLGILGDTAVEQLQVLRNEFGVDFTEFNIDQHFPTELSPDAVLETMYRLFRLSRCLNSITAKYKPITLGMIQDAITQGKMVTNS